MANQKPTPKPKRAAAKKVAAPKPKTFEINLEEAKAILDLIDIATKAGGIQVANQAAYFVNKFTAQ